MHSSRMRTVRCSGHLSGGGAVLSAEGVSAWGGCLPMEGCVCPEGRCLPRGGVHLPPLLTEFLTHACENITFPELLLRTIKIKNLPSHDL